MAPSNGQELSYQWKEHLSWQVAAEVLACSQEPLLVIETHPMTEQYDCLTFVNQEGASKILLNRNGQNALAGGELVTDIWETALNPNAGPRVLALRLLRSAGIGITEPSPPPPQAISAAHVCEWLDQHANRTTRVKSGWPVPSDYTPIDDDEPDYELLSAFNDIGDWTTDLMTCRGVSKYGQLFILTLDDEPVAVVNTANGQIRHRNAKGSTMGEDSVMRWDDPRLGYSKDDARTAAYRRAQSRWRETVLHLPYGVSSGGSPTGNMLRKDAPPNAQWLTEEVAEFVRQRTTGKRQDGDASISMTRLTHNLLSSMPMCFNLFGHLNAHPQAAARVLSHVLNTEIAEVGPMRVEYAPPLARELLGDNTAFDAYVPIQTPKGPGFLAVETKYTETFSVDEYNYPQYTTHTDSNSGWFRSGSSDVAVKSATNQLWRNTLLAQLTESAYADQEIGRGTVLVISTAGDPHANAALSGLAPLLVDDTRIQHVSFEQIIEAALGEPTLQYWAHLFAARYLFPVP